MKKRLICLALALILSLCAVCPALALTDLNTFATARFSSSYPVYSGPGSYYFRANNGKATMGAGGVCRVYGVAGDWVLIGYQTGAGIYRIGYIDKSALNKMYDVKGTYNPDLTFSGAVAWTKQLCPITDDPVVKNAPVYTIPQGTVVTALGTMGTQWTYVEVLGPSSYMRGFVSSSDLTYTPPYSPTPDPSQGQTPMNIPNTFYHDTNKGESLPSYQNVRFSRSYPVYSGPAVYYYRANEGKATMGGGVCRLYGVEENPATGKTWALIGYELSNGNFRIGYVDADGLPQLGLHIPYLDLRYITRVTLADCYVTDDIVMHKPVLLKISAGTPVIYLGMAYGLSTSWAYVEVMGTSSLMRGFIPASALGL